MTETMPLFRCTYIEWLVLGEGWSWIGGFLDVKSCILVDGNQQFPCYSGRAAYSEDGGNSPLQSPGFCLPNSMTPHVKQKFVLCYCPCLSDLDDIPCNSFHQFRAFSTCMFCKVDIILCFSVYLKPLTVQYTDLLTVFYVLLYT